MRTITAATRASWLNPVKDGPNRYTWRATVEYGNLQWWDYDTDNMPGGDYGNHRSRTGHYSSMFFTGRGVHEIPGILSGTITRALDQDIATLTMTVLNSAISPMGNTAEEYTGSLEYDVPGALSFDRGKSTIETNRWGHTIDTGWQDLLVPDRILKTYGGYGIDRDVHAGHDVNMYATGCWLIDKVETDSDGNLVITARDFARLLVDHIAMPPNIPWDSYPLEWSKIRSDTVQGRAPTGGSWWAPRRSSSITARSSNQLYVGAGITDVPRYVDSYGNVLGHKETDPIQVDGDRYWLSTGQESQDSMVWWELDLDDPIALNALRLKTFGGPFVVYVSLHDGTNWVGRKKIPYKVTTEGIDLNDKIPFVHRERFERGTLQDMVLKRVYGGIKKVRLTFTSLRRRPGAKVYPWRAGLFSIEAYKGSYGSLGFTASGPVTKAVGNYSDFSDIVKWICAWSGFWWPQSGAQATVNYGYPGPADAVQYTYTADDPKLARGRVWGSFQPTGTAGVADLSADQFDKQPLLDAIQVVRDIVGFNFFVDECAGAVWRMPNLWSFGNYRTPSHLEEHGRLPTYVPNFHEVIDEDDVLTSYGTTLDSANLRERIAIANSNGKVGAVVRGYQPYTTGLRRISCWTDMHWETNRECRVAADLVAAQQMFSFKTSVATIPPNPAIQIDDQIRVFERVTNETFYHYVTGLTESYDAQAGKASYTLQLHWLGERPSDAWVVRVDELDSFTQTFLNNLGVPE